MRFPSLATTAIAFSTTNTVFLKFRPASAYSSSYTYETDFYDGKTGDELPTWSDWIWVKAQVESWIDNDCPSTNAELINSNYWDYNNLTGGDADCVRFEQARNPFPIGSRLIRHAFHESAGGFDGFLDVFHDPKRENNGLDGTQDVLDSIYDSDDEIWDRSGRTVKSILNKADFSAWAFQAALEQAAQRQFGTNGYHPCEGVDVEGVDCDYKPSIAVKYGRPLLSYDSNNCTTFPPEHFPSNGPASSGQQLAAYFEDKFDLTPREMVTLMGAHTFGGARRTESGHTGMWTQSKNKLNVDYQLNLIDPIPIYCDAPTASGPDDCDYISATNSTSSDGDCGAGYEFYDGRCFGWEQQQITNEGLNDFPDRFQWRHSCNEDGLNCTHIMLNADMGLYRDLDGFICTDQDENATASGIILGQKDDYPVIWAKSQLAPNHKHYRNICKKGMIKKYPTILTNGDTPCDADSSSQRVLARCFNLIDEDDDPNTASFDEELSSTFIASDSSDLKAWIDDFSPLFQKILEWDIDEKKMYSDPSYPSSMGVTLTTLTGSDVHAEHESCPVAGCLTTANLNSLTCGRTQQFQCIYCATGVCQWMTGQDVNSAVFKCKEEDPTEPWKTATNEDCPCAVPNGIANLQNFDCECCTSGECKKKQNHPAGATCATPSRRFLRNSSV